MSDHSQIPFIVCEAEYRGDSVSGIRAADGDLIANGCLKSDAAFIVRACNSHEALVEALKGFFSFNDGTPEWDAAIDKANAALRLAKP